MAIIVNLDVMMAKRKISSQTLARKLGITNANLSILKTGKGKAIRFTTLDKICEELNTYSHWQIVNELNIIYDTLNFSLKLYE